MQTKHWARLKPFYVAQDWILTHAGVHPDIALHPVKGWDLEKFTEEVDKNLRLAVSHKMTNYIFRVGRARGGDHKSGGITWCDYNVEFEPIEGLKQVFGHTPGKEARQYKDTDNWCIDTGLNHIGIIEDGVFKTLKI